MVIAINNYAEPGAGKSSTAGFVFSYLKNRGYHIELVQEYAKELIYEGCAHLLKNQIGVFAEQYRRMRRIAEYGKVPIMITDSPILLGTIYAEEMGIHYANELKPLIKAVSDVEFQNVNVLVRRVKPYNPHGRTQTEAETEPLRKKIEALALSEGVDYEINGDEAGQSWLAEQIIARYGDRIRI